MHPNARRVNAFVVAATEAVAHKPTTCSWKQRKMIISRITAKGLCVKSEILLFIRSVFLKLRADEKRVVKNQWVPVFLFSHTHTVCTAAP